MNVSVSNTGGEPAYSAELQVNIDPTFAYVGRSDDVSDIHCDFRGVGLGVVCRYVYTSLSFIRNAYKEQFSWLVKFFEKIRNRLVIFQKIKEQKSEEITE